MSDLLNSYTFEAKKIVYYSVTVGANNKTEAKRIASDFEGALAMAGLIGLIHLLRRGLHC